MKRSAEQPHVPTVQADDVHAVIRALGVGPIEIFASSGGVVIALALVAAHPTDVNVLVAHEPPLVPVLPDAEAAERAMDRFQDNLGNTAWRRPGFCNPILTRRSYPRIHRGPSGPGPCERFMILGE